MGEVEWEPPGDGVWWYSAEHMPDPVSGLFAAIFPPVSDGWVTGARRYGIPMSKAAWGEANCYLYFSPGPGAPAATEEDEERAAAALAGRAWRDEVDRWFDVERPAVVARNREFQAVDVGALDDDALAAHVQEIAAHFGDVAPLHFEHTGFDIAAGLLFEAANEWGIDDGEVASLLTGASPASSAAVAHLDRIASALPEEPPSIDDIRRHAPAELDAYLEEHGWRVLRHELCEPTLAERPELLAATVRARMRNRATVERVDPAGVRAKVPAGDRARFDQLLDDARRSYQLRDDDVGVCFAWPLGLLRRAVLEAAGRLDVTDGDDLFEASPDEIAGMLRGASEPTAAELHQRAERHRRAHDLSPPPQLGEMPAGWGSGPAPPPSVARITALREGVWAAGNGLRREGPLRGIGIGTGAASGRARLFDAADAVERIEEGDVVVCTMTTTAYNVVLPLAAAIATEEGGLFSHAAILARELGIPAVVGVAGLLHAVGEGALVEVDADAGEVRLLAQD